MKISRSWLKCMLKNARNKPWDGQRPISQSQSLRAPALKTDTAVIMATATFENMGPFGWCYHISLAHWQPGETIKRPSDEEVGAWGKLFFGKGAEAAVVDEGVGHVAHIRLFTNAKGAPQPLVEVPMGTKRLRVGEV